jgi:hypothetical protein
MPYERSAVIMAQNFKTLTLKPSAMTWVLNTVFESVYAYPEWRGGKKE